MAFSGKMQAWWQASRPPFYVATVVPLTLGFVLAGRDAGQWLAGRFLLINLGAFMVHLATNLADDLFDYILGADAGDSIGGSRVVHQGKISLSQLAWALVILYSLAFLTAGWVIRASGQHGLWLLVAVSAFSSFFYVAPPVKYGYRGLGELSVFLNMGIIMVCGSYWALAGAWSWNAVWHAVPVGLMVANILFFQSLPDMRTDEDSGKITLAVRLGRKRAAAVFRLWWAATGLSLAGLYLFGLAGPIVWLSVLTLPLFLKTDRLIQTAGDWQEIDQHGHLVRKLYLINGALLIAASYWRNFPF